MVVSDQDSQKLELYLAHRAALVDYAAPIVGGRAQAEDIVQEAWLRFNQSAPASGLRQPVSYLYRIVRNLALDLNRRLKLESCQPVSHELLQALPSNQPSPEHATLCQNELYVIQQALNELPDRTRLAFELHRLAELPLQQVANQMNISVGLAHQLVHKALSHCADRISDD